MSPVNDPPIPEDEVTCAVQNARCGARRPIVELRASLQAFCKEHLASYKSPAYVAFVEELPRNPMGKVLKTDLRRDHGGADNE